jgi:hypothetical protein
LSIVILPGPRVTLRFFAASRRYFYPKQLSPAKEMAVYDDDIIEKPFNAF